MQAGLSVADASKVYSANDLIDFSMVFQGLSLRWLFVVWCHWPQFWHWYTSNFFLIRLFFAEFMIEARFFASRCVANVFFAHAIFVLVIGSTFCIFLQAAFQVVV